MIDLNAAIPESSGWTLQFSSSINNRGQLVGQGGNPNGETHGFLLTPIGQRTNGLRLNDLRQRPGALKRMNRERRKYFAVFCFSITRATR
jgi:hypothetical protein